MTPPNPTNAEPNPSPQTPPPKRPQLPQPTPLQLLLQGLSLRDIPATFEPPNQPHHPSSDQPPLGPDPRQYCVPVHPCNHYFSRHAPTQPLHQQSPPRPLLDCSGKSYNLCAHRPNSSVVMMFIIGKAMGISTAWS